MNQGERRKPKVFCAACEKEADSVEWHRDPYLWIDYIQVECHGKIEMLDSGRLAQAITASYTVCFE